MTQNLKTIFHVYDEENEMEGFFDYNGAYIHGWALNDAQYRYEYMTPLVNYLGYDVVRTDDKDLIKKLREVWFINEK